MLQTSHIVRSDPSSADISVPLFALDQPDEHFTAIIQSSDNQTIQLQTKSPLNPGRRLVMKHKGCRTELEVISCRKENDRTCYLDCKVVSVREGTVRNDWRMPVNWPARVRVPPATDQYKARIRDMSVFGLGIEIEFEPEPDSLIIVNMQSGTGFGRVRHCRRITDNSYFVGLYLDEFIPDEQYSHGAPARSLTEHCFHLLSKLAHRITQLSWT